MRKLSSFLLIVLLLVSFTAVNSLAGDKFFSGTITHKESFSQVWYKVVFPANADSTGSQHSNPLFIADCNDADGYCDAITNAAADINIIYHFSKDCNSWYTTTPAGFDATSSTLKTDSIGVEAGTNDINFHNARWLVVECDRQDGTNQTDYLTYNITMTKDLDLQQNGQPIWVGGYKKTRSGYTNP